MRSLHQINDGNSRHRVFVVGAASREELVDRVANLQGTLHENVVLDELAAKLAAECHSGPLRLAVIAATVDELRDRLERARGRLEDGSRSRIRDNAGIYYAAEPLYEPGCVAFLYPGEGAQYLGMVAGLPERFPFVDSILARCREIEPALKLPAGSMERCLCSTESKDPHVDELLQSFSFSIFAVMACSWCIGEVLNSLDIQADMIAGHSAGESSALFAAGAIPTDTPFSILNTIADIGRHDGSDSGMLAVGAGKTRVEELLSAHGLLGDEAQLYIAMDNCPHQVIAVGTAGAIDRAAEVLKKSNIILQRLAIPRPYHTPLFVPYMPTLTKLGYQVELQTPHIPLYSCSTAERFRDDPEEIRRLSIDHWQQPVEFTRLIQQMYEDGARIFVEVGPRGNLTSFAEDILRGRNALTVAANRTGRSATLQIAHVVGELWVHGMPLSLELSNSDAPAEQPPPASAPSPSPRFEMPTPVAVDSAANSAAGASSDSTPAASQPQPTAAPPTTPKPPVPPLPQDATRLPAASPVMAELPAVLRRNRQGSARPQKQRIWDAIRQSNNPPVQDRQQQALVAHQRVMQKFLDTQRSVINGYLQARSGGSADVPPPAIATLSGDVPAPPADAGDDFRSATTGPLPPNFPLAGEIMEHVQGERIVIRRPLDLAEDLYADHHTVGGQSISGVDPNHHGLPVMPMTFFLEMIAEAAKQLFPQLYVTTIRKLRLRKWLPFYADDPGTVEVRINRKPSEDPHAVVFSAEVHDLGTSQTAQRLGEKGEAAVCEVEMRREYSEIDFGRYELKDPRPCPTSIERLYLNLFHGPILQGMTSIDLMDDQFIEASVTVQPREEVFASTSQPDYLFDPVMLDIVMHPLAAWHLADPDQTGRIMLPFEQEEIEFYGGAPDVGERLHIQGQLEKMTTRQCIENLLVRREDGRPWCRMRRAKFWRFYLPFYNVSFHGPKDIYYLTEDWSGLLPSSDSKEPWAQPFTQEHVSCIRFQPPQDMVNPSIQVAASYVVMSPIEKAQFELLEGTLAEKSMWMFQRFAAKDAVRRYREYNNDVRTFAADVEVQSRFDLEPASSIFATSAREGFDDRPFPPVAGVVRDGFHYSVGSFHERFGLDVCPHQPGDEGIPELLHPYVDQVTATIVSREAVAQRLISAIAAISLAQGATLDLTTIAQLTHRFADSHHYFQIATQSETWLVLSTGTDEVIVSIAVDQSSKT